MTMGTVGYLSPEQVRGEPVTGSCDIYALGLVLLEAFTGRPAFVGSPAEVALARLTAAPPMVERLPERLRALLAVMTAREPADRPSADAVAAGLRLMADRGPAITEIIPTVSADPSEATKRPYPILALLAGLAAVAVVIAVLIRGRPSDAPGGRADHADPILADRRKGWLTPSLPHTRRRDASGSLDKYPPAVP